MVFQAAYGSLGGDGSSNVRALRKVHDDFVVAFCGVRGWCFKAEFGKEEIHFSSS